MTGGPPGVPLRVVPDAGALADAAAADLARCAAEAVAARGTFRIALAGGATPRALYRLLADPRAPWRGRVPWDRTEVFFGDERAVPPGHPDSNHRMAAEALLAHVAPAEVHRIEGERDPAEAAERYEAVLRSRFAGEPAPTFDLVLLGLGADGHTASLFPGSPALEERRRWAVAAPGPEGRPVRITLTLPGLAGARRLLFLVAGAGKAAALERLVHPAAGDAPGPAARVARDARGAVEILADAAAAAAAG